MAFFCMTMGLLNASHGNEIFSNIVKNCSYGLNIRLSNSKSNLIYNNYLINNTVGIGVLEQGINTEIYNNNILENNYGITIGLLNLDKENITIYHNNFIANTYQVSIDIPTLLGGTKFDNKREGNFWSNYNGTDDNNDGIGDTPYIIGNNYQDRYPLMQPIEITSLDSIKTNTETNTGLNATIVIASASAISTIAIGILLITWRSHRKTVESS
jgi:nitrous oxidase accessory protein NosD